MPKTTPTMFSTDPLTEAVGDIENFPSRLDGLVHSQTILGATSAVLLSAYDGFMTQTFTTQNFFGHEITSLAVGSLAGATAALTNKSDTLYDLMLTEGVSAALWRFLVEVIMFSTKYKPDMNWTDAIIMSLLTGIGFGAGTYIYKKEITSAKTDK